MVPASMDGEARTSSALDLASLPLVGEVFPQTEPSSDPSYPDPSTLPPAHAAASAPKIDPTEAGTFSGMAVYDVDMQALADKNWRRPGADVSDWFNYGFDEISWEAYCVRRRDMAALAAELRANVLASNFISAHSLLVINSGFPTHVRTSRTWQGCRKRCFKTRCPLKCALC